ncbi:MAG: baculoviral IAP repeat-containing protein [Candidatus Endonucleobacter bathymodioli]|uniref:Baculoviral IAP repeat-containing protein n=1 Tax=Candidatus Endonucleibacter bathymodioli TaxID=539814 RepID=A0AA90NLC6_9GAMM|nr:baculoviral IAP repeat-containing protein [Candidatus Endonucleobacter bathymodioli]
MKYVKYMKVSWLFFVYQLSFPCIATDTVSITNNELDLSTYRYYIGKDIDVDCRISMFETGVSANAISGTITNNISSECHIELGATKLRWQQPLDSSAQFILAIACNNNITFILSTLKTLFNDSADTIFYTEPKKSKSIFISTALVEFEVWEFPLSFKRSGEIEIAVHGCGFLPTISQWEASDSDIEKDTSEVILSFLKKKCVPSLCENTKTINALKCNTKHSSLHAYSSILPDFFYQDFLQVRPEVNIVFPATSSKPQIHHNAYSIARQKATKTKDNLANLTANRANKINPYNLKGSLPSLIDIVTPLKHKTNDVTKAAQIDLSETHNRALTFKHPIDIERDMLNRDNITVDSMANSGFSYVGGNNVKCFSCGIILSNWEKGDVPKIEHTLYSEECTHVKTHITPYLTDTEKYTLSEKMIKKTRDNIIYAAQNGNFISITEDAQVNYSCLYGETEAVKFANLSQKELELYDEGIDNDEFTDKITNSILLISQEIYSELQSMTEVADLVSTRRSPFIELLRVYSNRLDEVKHLKKTTFRFGIYFDIEPHYKGINQLTTLFNTNENFIIINNEFSKLIKLHMTQGFLPSLIEKVIHDTAIKHENKIRTAYNTAQCFNNIGVLPIFSCYLNLLYKIVQPMQPIMFSTGVSAQNREEANMDI